MEEKQINKFLLEKLTDKNLVLLSCQRFVWKQKDRNFRGFLRFKVLSKSRLIFSYLASSKTSGSNKKLEGAREYYENLESI